MATDRTTLWLRPARGSRGRAPEHTRDGIAAIAVRLADADGLGAVTIRSVAEALGTGSASLYRYVESRDELVALMVDQVNGELDHTRLSGDHWLADLLALGRQSRAAYLRHPWLTEAPTAAGDLGPNALAYLEHALAAMRDLDVDGHRKLEAIGVFSAVVRLLARAEIEQRDTDPAARRLHLEAAAQLVGNGAYPYLTAVMSAPPADPDGEQAERLLTRLLRGLLEA